MHEAVHSVTTLQTQSYLRRPLFFPNDNFIKKVSFNFLDSATSSVSWRLSPSSSGYKTQSQRSESVTPSPTSTPYLSGHDSTNSMATNASDPSLSHTDNSDTADNQVVWAVTDIQSVPTGSIIINPQVRKVHRENKKKTIGTNFVFVEITDGKTSEK